MTSDLAQSQATSEPYRLGILDVGADLADILAALGDAPAAGVTTVVVHTGAVPWAAREADETWAVEDTSAAEEPTAGAERRSASVPAVVETIRRARLDGVLLGRGAADLVAAGLLQACEDAGIAVAGPTPAQTARLADLDALARATGLARGRSAEPARLVQVDAVTDGTRVLTTPIRDVVLDSRGRVVLAELPSSLPAAQRDAADQAARRIAENLGGAGAFTIRLRVSATAPVAAAAADVAADSGVATPDDAAALDLAASDVAAAPVAASGDTLAQVALEDVDVLGLPDRALLGSAADVVLQARLGLLRGHALPASLPEGGDHVVAVTVAVDPTRALTAVDATHAPAAVDGATRPAAAADAPQPSAAADVTRPSAAVDIAHPSAAVDIAQPSAAVVGIDVATGTGVRAGLVARVGDAVDGRLVTLAATGDTRERALARLTRAVERTSLVLDGGASDRSALLLMLRHGDVVSGAVGESWFARHEGELVAPADPIALVAAGVEAYESDLASVRAEFLAGAARGRPQNPEEVGARLTFDYRGTDVDVAVERRNPTHYHLALTSGGRTVHVDAVVDVIAAYERRLRCAGRSHRVVASEQGAVLRLSIDGVEHVVAREDGFAVRTPRPALVAELLVGVGDQVRAGQPVATLESMKMLSTVVSPYDGVVTAVPVLPNTQVERGAALVRVRDESVAESATAGAGSALDLDALVDEAGADAPSPRETYGRLRDYLLGYDLSPAALKDLLAAQKSCGAAVPADDPELVQAEDALLDLYADVAALYRPRTEADAWVTADDGVDPAESTGTQEYVLSFLQWMDADRAELPAGFRERLARALRRYGLTDLRPGADLDAAALWMFRSFARVPALSGAISTILTRRMDTAEELRSGLGAGERDRLDRLARAAQGRAPAVADLARDAAFTLFEQPVLDAAVEAARTPVLAALDALAGHAEVPADERARAVETLMAYPHPLRAHLLASWIDSDPADTALRGVLVEVMLRRYYRQCALTDVRVVEVEGRMLACADHEVDGRREHVVAAFSSLRNAAELAPAVRAHLDAAGLLTGPEADRTDVAVDVFSWRRSPVASSEEFAEAMQEQLRGVDAGRRVERVTLTVTSNSGTGKEHTRTQAATFVQDDAGTWVEDPLFRNLHPSMAERIGLWRLSNFDLRRLASPEDVYLFYGTAKENPSDARLFALVEARDLTRVTSDDTTGVGDATPDATGAGAGPAVDGRTSDARGTSRASYPGLERLGISALAAMRAALATFPPRQRPKANRLFLVVRPEWTVPAEEWAGLARAYEPLSRGVGLQRLEVDVRVREGEALVPKVITVEGLGGRGLSTRLEEPRTTPVSTLTRYAQKVLTAERFGVPYPYEIIRMLAPAQGESGAFPRGTFVEFDLDESVEAAAPRLVPVDREPGNNTAHLVVGEITTFTDVVPEGMRRVAILSDPTQGLGNLSEPECVRINAALEYAAAEKLPVEWYAVSSGALISLESGTENMDWISNTLRRIIEFTQAGGEVNVIVTGINVGGQPYWNAEATMLMHTKGVLIMTPASQMVLTGKQALEFSGAVAADDNFGIGGYDRIMGPNGQAQYFAADFEDACRVLLHHYDYTYVVPGERFPRRRPTVDVVDRDVRTAPHPAVLSGGVASRFDTVGQVFEDNPERKKPFDMRAVMRAVADTDDVPLERWKHWRDADNGIVWDARIGGIPVSLLGIESHAVPRSGFVPSDGPPSWTAGTLFPQASRKIARAVNAASGNRPLVVLANLSGFDGSPESMRNWQLEYGAEIGRAVTNFDGPIVFVVVSRYHGGAFVVFSRQLNDHMQVAAVEGSYASVIGGAPAAATVFAREVKKRTAADPRVAEANPSEVAAVTARVHSEKLGEMATEFDGIHSVDRAQRVGSVQDIIAPETLRPWIIEALERGMAEFDAAAPSA